MSDRATRLDAALEGRYRVEEKLGEGGMAIVYLARDEKHNRNVALKVLKPELAAVVGAERFLTEIETTANLQHPHILPLFDSGEADGFLFYVMPHVEGESLRERLAREHQLPVDRAVDIASKVASALDYAHRHGVVHRDIKPANILLHDGQPVVADFGIALAVSEGGEGRLTETGLSLGTPHYMSPEQATGDQAVGAATDIYALGCVLYEMLVGEPPYTGGTPQAVLGKIITGTPAAVTEQRSSVPPNVDAAVGRALEKVPADRFGTAEDLARALTDPGFRHGQPTGVDARAVDARWKWVAAAGWASTTVVGALALSSLLQSEPEVPLTRFDFTPPGEVTISVPGHRGLAVSPDERTIVFTDVPTGLLHRREVGQLDAMPIPGTETAWFPFFSPDGAWVGFFSQVDAMLKKVRLDGTDLQSLARVPPTTRSAGWSDDGSIVVHTNSLDGLWRVPDTGGQLQPTAVGDGPALGWLDLLPGGQAVLASQVSNSGETRIVAVRLDSGERTDLVAGTTPRYVEGGYVVFWRDDALWSAPFDPEALSLTGEPLQVVRDVRIDTNNFAHFAVRRGVLVYQPSGGSADGLARELVWIDREGQEKPLGLPPSGYQWPRISPDGSKMALVRDQNENRDIWILDLETQALRQLTFDTDDDYSPVWTPDGRDIFFGSYRNGPNADLYRRPADGSGTVERVLERDAVQIPNAWTPDGQLVFSEYVASGLPSYTLFTYDPDGGAAPEPLLADGSMKRNAALSPDGAWIAYESGELEGRPEVFVRTFPELSGQRLVSTLELEPVSGFLSLDQGEGRWPGWSPDGRELFYRSFDAFVRVQVEEGGAFGTPELLSRDLAYYRLAPGAHFDVASDGRLLVIRALGTGDSDEVGAFPNRLVVVQNWFEELRGRLETNR